jgi:hypothetical protein
VASSGRNLKLGRSRNQTGRAGRGAHQQASGIVQSLHGLQEKNWGGKRESNPQPSEPQSGALPVELFPPQLSDYSNWISGTDRARGRGLRIYTSEPRWPAARLDQARPIPTYSNPRARKRAESSRFLVSTITGFFNRCLIRSKSRARNSGQPVPTTRASEPSAAA